MEWDRGEALGKGCYATVYLGIPRNPFISPFIAMKTAPFEYSSSLMKELGILQDFVGIPEIIQTYGSRLSCHEDDGNKKVLYDLLLEYAPMGSLLNFINHYGGDGRIPEHDVKQYTRMLLKGIYRIHKKGYVHCDLKPGNILVFPSPRESVCQLKIADFGLARLAGDEGKEEVGFRGTPWYMSPESVQGMVAPPLDVWSLGCIVVEMLTGEPAWGSYTEEELLKKLVVEMETPKIPEFLSKRGKDFLKRCFEIDPLKRWTAGFLLTHPFLQAEETEDDHIPPSSSSSSSSSSKDDFVETILNIAAGLPN